MLGKQRHVEDLAPREQSLDGMATALAAIVKVVKIPSS